jgi:putative endonuclease
MGAWVYILRCRDGSYYIGSTSRDLDTRVGEHNEGTGGDYTRRRRPVELRWSEYFDSMVDAFFLERRLKGWSRAKKEAFMAGDYTRLKTLARRRAARPSS